jgi:hypothetical protein
MPLKMLEAAKPTVKTLLRGPLTLKEWTKNKLGSVTMLQAMTDA